MKGLRDFDLFKQLVASINSCDGFTLPSHLRITWLANLAQLADGSDKLYGDMTSALAATHTDNANLRTRLEHVESALVAARLEHPADATSAALRENQHLLQEADRLSRVAVKHLTEVRELRDMVQRGAQENHELRKEVERLRKLAADTEYKWRYNTEQLDKHCSQLQEKLDQIHDIARYSAVPSSK